MTYRLKLLADLQNAPAGADDVLVDLRDHIMLLNLLDRDSGMLLSTAEPVAK